MPSATLNLHPSQYKYLGFYVLSKKNKSTPQIGNWTFRGHANSQIDNSRTRQFADLPIRGQDVSWTCQFTDCGQFTERRLADNQDYSWTNSVNDVPVPQTLQIQFSY